MPRPSSRVGILLLVALLSACANLPVTRRISSVKAFAELRDDPEAYVGKVVILGGQVVEVANEPEQTVLVVLEKPLGLGNRPKPGDASGGRFLAHYFDYLDPVLFAPGRHVTVTGSVTGVEQGVVGEAPYLYVVVRADKVKLWQDRELHGAPWGAGDDWYPPWYDPYWGRRPWWW